ncbi:MAG: FAD-dependent protein, partial [Cyanobacteriota bacterium]
PGDPLAGVAFQRHWEQQAFAAGGGTYQAPAQTLADFLSGQAPCGDDGDGAERRGEGPVRGSYLPGLVMASLDNCLPDFVLSSIREALPIFGKTLPGYLLPEAILTGVETRTSSPVRIPRHPQTLESENTPGLFPAGEGAGYAGGILSAAIDGLKVAEATVRALSSPRHPHPGGPAGSACAQA